MKPLPFLFIIMVLLIIPLSFAVKPVTQISGGDTILEIRIPQGDHIKQNNDVHLNIHVFNKSDGLSVGEPQGISCYLDLYNATGNHFIDVLEMDRDGVEFDLDIGGENFSDLGSYSFMVYCNNSNIGGFISAGFDVTTTGEDEVVDNMPLIIVGSMVLIIALYFVVLIRLFSEREFTEHGLIKMMFHLIAFWAVLIPLNIVVQFLEHYAGPTDVVTSIQNLHEIIVYINYFITIYFVLWLLVQLLKRIGKSTNKLKLSNE